MLGEALLQHGSGTDLREARAAIERLAAAPTDTGFVLQETWPLRMSALLARAEGDTGTRPPIATSGMATVKWRHRLASRGTSRGRGDAVTAALLPPSFLISTGVSLLLKGGR